MKTTLGILILSGLVSGTAFLFLTTPASPSFEQVKASNLTSEWIELKRASPAYVRALLKAEDKDFFHHSGVEFSRSGSTLSMKTVRLLTPSNKWDGIIGKIRQMIATWKLERYWTKEEILEAYINTVPSRETRERLSRWNSGTKYRNE